MNPRFLRPVLCPALCYPFLSALTSNQLPRAPHLPRAASVISPRYCSTSSDPASVLRDFLSQEERKINLDDYSHPSLAKFSLIPSDSNVSKVCWSRKYGHDEIIKISIQVGDVTYSQEDMDYDVSKSNERRVHFQIYLSRPDEVDIEVNAFGSPKYRDFSLTHIIIHNEDGSTYKKSFYDFDAHVQDAFYGFIQERIGVSIAQAIQEYYDLVKEKLFQRWRVDLKEYIDA